MKALSHGKVEVLSAGPIPKDSINPVAIAAMAEDGIDISQNVPTLLTQDSLEASEVVITMGCGEACPFYPGKRYEDWALEDAAGKSIESLRPIRDDIKNRVEKLLSELIPSSL
jgi:arsenate reductase